MPASHEEQFREVVALYGAPLSRLVRGYERDADRARDLYQDILVAVWRSLSGFDGRASLRTWVYRVAHNVATSHVLRARARAREAWVRVEDLDALPDAHAADPGAREAVEWLARTVQRLRPIDRQIILLYLEGIDVAEIAEVTGLSVPNVSTKVHRIKTMLARRFRANEKGGAS